LPTGLGRLAKRGLAPNHRVDVRANNRAGESVPVIGGREVSGWSSAPNWATDPSSSPRPTRRATAGGWCCSASRSPRASGSIGHFLGATLPTRPLAFASAIPFLIFAAWAWPEGTGADNVSTTPESRFTVLTVVSSFVLAGRRARSGRGMAASTASGAAAAVLAGLVFRVRVVDPVRQRAGLALGGLGGHYRCCSGGAAGRNRRPHVRVANFAPRPNPGLKRRTVAVRRTVAGRSLSCRWRPPHRASAPARISVWAGARVPGRSRSGRAMLYSKGNARPIRGGLSVAHEHAFPLDRACLTPPLITAD
jgi:hypothetical protein